MTYFKICNTVLRDKYKRTVYDMYGEKGLETGDMEVSFSIN